VSSLVAGSNGDIAWGFTNSNGDWSDLVIVDRDPADKTRYRTPSGMRPFEITRPSTGGRERGRNPDYLGSIGALTRAGEYAVAWVPLRDGGRTARGRAPRRQTPRAAEAPRARRDPGGTRSPRSSGRMAGRSPGVRAAWARWAPSHGA
jgi:hypothetical protein